MTSGGGASASDPAGATPITAEEHSGLIPGYIATKGELNQAEQTNIASALLRMRGRRPTSTQILDDLFVQHLHDLMFDSVWRWAGTYRSTERNIGVAPWLISEQVRNLTEDAKVWIAASPSVFTHDETCARVHHRLVAIHPFPNGNGRHGRLYADLLAQSLGQAPFTWGSQRPNPPDEMRSAYIRALRAADVGNYGPLLGFIRS